MWISVIAAIAPNDSPARYGAMGVQVIAGEARFTDARTLRVGDATIRARRFVIATGSRPAVPPIPGLADTPFLTNETLFDLRRAPERLLDPRRRPGRRRDGAGASGGSASEVTLVEQRRAARQGRSGARRPSSSPRWSATASRSAPNGRGHACRAGAAGLLLLELADGAGARRLAPAGRDGPRAARRWARPRGGRRRRPTRPASWWTRGLRTSNRRVYAIGDCAGGPHAGDRLTHVANHHAGLVIRNALFRLPARSSRSRSRAWSIRSPNSPPSGSTKREARKRHTTIRVLRWPYAENDRAQAERLTAGEIKVITTASGTILGAGIVGLGPATSSRPGRWR